MTPTHVSLPPDKPRLRMTTSCHRYRACVRVFVRYEGDDKLLDEDDRGVMMEWERPLMRAHAEVVCQAKGDVLNVGFGMGIVDGFIQVWA
jgi:hypothetical protein